MIITKIQFFIKDIDANGIPLTVRTVFVIDPKKIIRLMISYPASTGRREFH